MIQDAEDALENGTIDAMQFLDRVTCDKSQIIKNMLNLEKVSQIDDGENDDAMEEEAEVGPTSDQTSLATTNVKLCDTCCQKVANCAHIPCGHVYFCMDCYHKWKNTDPDLFEFGELGDHELGIPNRQHQLASFEVADHELGIPDRQHQLASFQVAELGDHELGIPDRQRQSRNAKCPNCRAEIKSVLEIFQ